MTGVGYKLEGSNYDHQNVLARGDHDADEDEDLDGNTGGKPAGDYAKEEGRGVIANNIEGLLRGIAELDESAAMVISAACYQLDSHVPGAPAS
jgi:hypothetical protein